MPRHTWSKEIVIRHILKRHRNGQKLNSNFVQKKCIPLYMAACVYHGSWRKAIEVAGLTYDSVRITKFKHPVWSKEKIIKIIRRRNELGQPLNSNYIQTKIPRLYAATVKYFGGWPEAIAVAGLNYGKFRKRAPMRSWSKTMIVKEITKMFDRGESIKGGDVSLQNGTLYKAAMRHFGVQGWSKARVLAGFDPIDPSSWKIWNEKSVCEHVLELHESGVPLNTFALQQSPFSNILGAGCKVFGSWAKTIRACGLNYSKIRKQRINWWTGPRVILCIKNLERRGIRLSHRAIQQSHGGLMQAGILHFGSWSQAVEAAGISYKQHCFVFSTKAWLRTMSSGKYTSLLETAQTHSTRRRKNET